MTEKSPHRPPAHLRPSTKAWWVEVVETFHLESHHIHLLTLAAEALDRATQAREILIRKGLTFQDRFDQPRARPEAAIERAAKITFARLLRELDLDMEPPSPSARAPAIRSNR